MSLTQYIAPMQANFDLSVSESSKIRMVETESELTVQWLMLYIRNRMDLGPFTFQVP